MSIAINTAEDGIDELTTCIVYKYANETLKPLENQLNEKADDCQYEALQSALSTFKFGVMNAVIIVVTEYVLTKLIVGAGLIFAYLKSGRILSKAKDFISRKFQTKSKGAAVGNMISNVVNVATGAQDERIAISKMANDNLNNLMTIVTTERGNVSNYKFYQRKQFNDLLNLGTTKGRKSFDRANSTFQYKMQTGTWLNTVDDKRIFEKATGVEVKLSGNSTWSALVEKLNSFAPFAKDVEGKIINLAQVQLNELTARNIKRL